MAICDICNAIPKDSDGLPALPEERGAHRASWRYIHDLLDSWRKVELVKYPFHPTLDALKASAEECDLCRLILDSIEKVIEELRNPREELRVLQGPAQPTWKLWLAKRDYGDGFYVFSDCVDSKDIDFVAAVGFCTQENDPLASVYIGRPIAQNADDERTMAHVKKWVDNCNDHPTCLAETPPLPFRVIDLGDMADEQYVKLRETDGEKGNYICLSHCWGKVTQFTTTKASLATHKVEIRENDLPKTFRDAIAITRLLKVRYLWIDSLCICQDDGEDWERESAKMTSIYMNSFLTIAASAAKDSSVGCFVPRRTPRYVNIPHTTKDGVAGNLKASLLPVRKELLPDLYVDMADHIGEPDHPLATRAWAVQERMLPRRVLHFGKHQIYLECNQGFSGENGLHLPWRYHSLHDPERNRRGPVVEDKQEAALQLWRSMLWDYGTRNLTHPSDKFPAISGVARLIAERIQDEYLAGLWRKSLLEELNWQGLGARRVSKYRAPSWSWASIDGTPAMGGGRDFQALAEVLNYNVKLKGKNVFGEVESGWIKLKAPLVPVILDGRIDPQNTGVPYENNPLLRSEKGDPEGFYSRFDFPFTAPTAREEALALVDSLKGVDLFLLILGSSMLGKLDWEEDDFYYTLIVRRTVDDASAMQRLGFAHCTRKELGDCSQIENRKEWSFVTLV